MLTDVAGVRVGHWTDAAARTGCTVILFPSGTVAGVSVGGGAPASRELALLDAHRTVQRCDAVLLTGGSAFGLAAADGVMLWCEERGIGVPTPAGPVPIVPALALFDLAVGQAAVRPDHHAGYSACVAASSGAIQLGTVGAGTGATIGAWRGAAHVRPGGLTSATMRAGALVVSALLAVNAFGDIDADGSGLEAAAARVGSGAAGGSVPALGTGATFANTTIGVVATNARLDKVGCTIVARGAEAALARCIVPAHTRADGDAIVAAATAELGDDAGVDVDAVQLLAAAAVERAVRALP